MVVPAWGRYVAGVVNELVAAGRAVPGARGVVTTTLPIGAGLSSSAALELAVALALGFDGVPEDLALLGQRAEQAASGVPCGVMDQLASASGVAGHALLMDCDTLAVSPVRLPEGWRVLVAHSGEKRELAGSAYAERRAATEAAAAILGPLPFADRAAVEALEDPVLRRRARHVRTECDRVRAVAESQFDRAVVADAMAGSHASLRDDFEVSTPGLDRLVAHLTAQPGVIGARLTGAGFGGCVVALVEADAHPDVDTWQHWWVQPAGPARLLPA
jgi:galactokinase